MFPIETFANSLRKLSAILRQHCIRFHLTGGITSVAYGEPRMTQDVDLVVDSDAISRCMNPFLESLSKSDFLFDEQTVHSAIKQRGMFQVLDKLEALKFDLYARELIPGELNRSQSLEVFEGEVYPIVSRSDAALSKLIWISKGSHKSRQDLRRIFAFSDESVRSQITTQAAEMQLTNLLHEVLSEADEMDAPK